MRKVIVKQSGFTLIELLIVIVILGVLAAALIPNLSKFTGPGEIQKQEANYEVFVNESGIETKIGNVVMGEMLIQYPKMMLINDSDAVIVTLISKQNTITIGKNDSDGITNLSKYDIKSDIIQIYPIMNAELKAANFTISNESHGYEQSTTETNVHWVWIVAPKQTGNQLLLVELSTPLQLEGFEGVTIKAVCRQQFTIQVDKPFNWGEFLKNAGIIVGIITGIVAPIILILNYRKESRKGKKQGKV